MALYDAAAGGRPVHIVIFTPRERDALASLELLQHAVTTLPPTPAALAGAPDADLLIVDGASDLVAARALCRLLENDPTPVILVASEGGLAAVSPAWGVRDIVLPTAGPAEIEARLRLAANAQASGPVITRGLEINEASYQAKIDGKPIDLTYKEFELLRFLASNPERVFTREQLLSGVWGHDYFGGTRTVDVHVRRLRAKLGDVESVIGTVRGVGYRFDLVDE